MPNWVQNQIILEGSLKERERLCEYVKNDDREFDFNNIIPMPKDLKDSTSPTRIVSEEEYKKNGRGITQQMSDDLISKYGYDSWYEWACANWGTKWNACDVYVDDVCDVIEFNTAWSTPVLLLRKLSEEFPQLKLTIQYADEDFGHNVGKYVFQGGVTIDDDIPEGGTDKAYAMAIEISGDEEYRLWDEPCYWEEEDEGDYYDVITQLIHDKKMVNEEYPLFLLKKLEQMSVDAEEYENAQQIKDIIDKKL